jgi:hypothetical protein
MVSAIPSVLLWPQKREWSCTVLRSRLPYLTGTVEHCIEPHRAAVLYRVYTECVRSYYECLDDSNQIPPIDMENGTKVQSSQNT